MDSYHLGLPVEIFDLNGVTRNTFKRNTGNDTLNCLVAIFCAWLKDSDNERNGTRGNIFW